MAAKSTPSRTRTSRLDGTERLEDLPSIGPAAARYLRRIGVRKPGDLVGKDPFELYRRLCRKDSCSYDPCLCDQFIAAVRFVKGAPARAWWTYTAERKKVLGHTTKAASRRNDHKT
jgi:hypothetical protein